MGLHCYDAVNGSAKSKVAQKWIDYARANYIEGGMGVGVRPPPSPAFPRCKTYIHRVCFIRLLFFSTGLHRQFRVECTARGARRSVASGP